MDKGIDKYKTLKKIREGTGEFDLFERKTKKKPVLVLFRLVKRRIDEFEAM